MVMVTMVGKTPHHDAMRRVHCTVGEDITPLSSDCTAQCGISCRTGTPTMVVF